ncbi:MAG: OmpA/MotB family protein [Thermoguttaceae bacterium]
MSRYLLQSPQHAFLRCRHFGVVALVLLALCLNGGCAAVRKMTGKNETASPYTSSAPLFDPATAVVADPASIPPIIRGNVASETVLPTTSFPTTTPSPIPPPLPGPICSVSDADRAAMLTARVVELESQIARRDAMLASRDMEIAGLYRTNTVATPESQTVHTVAKMPSESGEFKPLVLPVIVAPDVKVTQQGNTIRVTIPDSSLFQSGSYELAPTGEATLRQVVSEIKMMYPDASLEIEGHSDNVVTNPQNPTQLQEVTSYKANIVMRYIVSSLGVNAAKIHPSGFGATCPIADNATDEGRRTNRRFVIVVRPFGG